MNNPLLQYFHYENYIDYKTRRSMQEESQNDLISKSNNKTVTKNNKTISTKPLLKKTKLNTIPEKTVTNDKQSTTRRTSSNRTREKKGKIDLRGAFEKIKEKASS